jgi:PmbA protein
MAAKPRKPVRPSSRKSSKKAAKKAAKKPATKKKVAVKKAPSRNAPAKKASGRKAPTRKAPARKAPAKKAAAKKSPARKAPSRKSTPRKPTSRKPAPRKTVAREPATRKAVGRKTVGRKAAARKSPAGRAGAKRPTPRATAPRKLGTKKVTAKKTAVKRTAAKKITTAKSVRTAKTRRLPGQRPAPRPAKTTHHLAGRPSTRPSPIAAAPKTTTKPHPVPARPRGAKPASGTVVKPKHTPALDLVADLVAKAKAAGADAADALIVESAALSLAQRLGKPDKLERAESSDLGLRVLIGRRQAVVSSTDTSPTALAELVERAVAMARNVPEDPHCGLADKAEIARGIPTLDMFDATEPSPEAIKEQARACEEAALAVAGVTNSEGAEAGWSRSTVTLYASNGFAGAYALSRHSVSVSVIAGEGTGMESDYDYATSVYAADLDDPAAVGARAGERAVARLKPRKAATAKVPVIYDPRVSNSLVSHLAGAIGGSAIARGTSFLKDKLGSRILPQGVMVVDDPHRRRGLRSKPFDGEGLANRPRNIVEDGVLTTWILDLRSARQLGLKSTGHAARGTSSPPSPAPTNLYLTPGEMAPEELIAGVKTGFYVTHLMGFGINGTTGDYSRGAAGFWIENGALAYPVSEVTVAGNLIDMYLNLTPANDLEFRYGTDAPTIRVDGMTVAGV